MRQIQVAGLHLRLHQLVALQFVDVGLAVLRVQRLAGNIEGIGLARSRHSDINVGFRQKLPVSIGQLDEHLAHGACAVGDHGDGRALNRAVPKPALHGVPLDLHLLAQSQLADFRLVKVSPYPQVVQVGHFDKRLAVLGKFRGTRAHTIDSACNRRADFGFALHLNRRCQSGLCVGKCRARALHFCRGVAVLRHLLGRMQAGLGCCQPLPSL